MNELKIKYLILGGGISGLSLGNFLEKNYLILEHQKEVGGYCRTIKRGDYIWDYAGHFYHFKDEKIKKMFLDNLNPDDIVKQKKCTKIFYKGKLIDYPFQKNIHQLEKEEFIECLYDLYFKNEKETYQDFLDMLYGKFGISIVEKFLKPYNEKLYACDLTKLDVDAMGRFFPYADLTDIIKNMKNSNNTSYNDTFLYPKDGAQKFIDVLSSKIPSENILCNKTVTKVNIEEKYVLTKDGQKINYEFLLNTIPLTNFLTLINNKYSDISKELSYNKVLVFNLGFDKKSKFTEEHWIYIPEKKYNFYRVGFYDNILKSSKLSMYIEIGFDKNSKINIEEELNKTLDGLKEIGIVGEDMNLIDYVPLIMDPAYVHINKEDMKKVNSLFEYCHQWSVYSIGRYGQWKYCSMEDCILDAMNLSNSIKEKE